MSLQVACGHPPGPTPPADYAPPLRSPWRAAADDVQIGERAGHEQAMGILLKTPVADLGELEHAFEDAEDMLDPAADLGLDTVTSPLDLVYHALVSIVAVREVAGLQRLRPDHRLLTLVGRVAPHSGLFAMFNPAILDARARQLPFEPKSGGIQPAYIRVIDRR